MKALPVLADGSVDTRGDLGTHFDDVLDELHSTEGDASHVSADEIERTERWERGFLAALKQECNLRLGTQGLVVRRAEVARDGTEGYLIVIADRYSRRFDCYVGFDEAIEKAQHFGENAGREIIDLVCAKALAARDKYFARMM